MTQQPIFTCDSTVQDALRMCPEIYQDVVINGKIVQKGGRDCQERGDMILQHIEDGESVLDMGANFSYFGQRILSEKKNCCYLGIEREVSFSFIAGKVLQPFKGGVALNGDLDYDTLKLLDDSCTMFDTIILTSIIHHFPMDKLVEMCLILDRMSRKVIIEASIPGDEGACGQHVLDNIFGRFRSIEDALCVLFPNKNFELIGEAKSHVSEINRPLYVGKQKGGKGNYKKAARDPYIGKMSNERKYFIHGDKMVKQNLLNPHNEVVDLVPGFLLWDWAMCGTLMSPTKEEISQQAIEEFNKLPKTATDIRPWNMIWSAEGLTYIDMVSQHEPDHCNFNEDDVNIVLNWIDSVYQ